MCVRLVERDYQVLHELNRWRCITGKQIFQLCDFPSLRTCDRRLLKLLQSRYVSRKKILYGIPYLYSITVLGQKLIHASGLIPKQKIEQIPHDLEVVNTAIYLNKIKNISFKDMVTEIQMHRKDGFSNRKHEPDLIYQYEGKKVCVEVELTLKAIPRFHKNIENNFINYDQQIWIVPDRNTKIAQILEEQQKTYINITIVELKEVRECLIS